MWLLWACSFWISVEFDNQYGIPSVIHLGMLCGSFNISFNASNNCLCIDVRYFSQKLWTLSAPGVFQLWENLITVVVISFISIFFHSGLFISLYIPKLFNCLLLRWICNLNLPCSYLSVKFFGIIFECSLVELIISFAVSFQSLSFNLELHGYVLFEFINLVGG